MELYGIYSLDENDKDYVKPVALKFSEDNNIIEARNLSGERKGKKIWANQKLENGLDGGYTELNEEQKLRKIKNRYNTVTSEKYRRDHKESHLKRGQKIKNTLNMVDENGKTGYKRRGEVCSKTLQTMKLKLSQQAIKRNEKLRNDIDENGLNGLQRRSLKGVQTQRNNIDENGLNGLQRRAQKANKAVENLRNDIDENGLNGLQRRAQKANKTQKNNLDENGLNGLQRRGLKYKEVLQRIGKDGLTLLERQTKTQKQTLEKKSIERFGLFELYINNKLKDNLYSFTQLRMISQVLKNATKEYPYISKNGDIMYVIPQGNYIQKNLQKREKEVEQIKYEKSVRKNGLFIICGSSIKEHKTKIYTRIELINISQALLKSTKEEPMGSSKISISKLIRDHKEFLIGTYIKKLKRIDT